MPEEFYHQDFPNLKAWELTSDPDPSYRCLSFAIGETGRNWWPGEYHPWSPDYWPLADPQTLTLQAFAAGLATLGYVPADDAYEEGFDRIALYALGQEVTHAARQLDGQWWQSKLGPDEDIKHTLLGLEGPKYGTVIAYFKKSK